MQICNAQHVRKRWKLTRSMALGRSSNCLLESMQLAPDGSWKSSAMLIAPWTTTRAGSSPKAILSVLASTSEGFEVGGPDHVCRLKKSLYGLKQAGRVWILEQNPSCCPHLHELQSRLIQPLALSLVQRQCQGVHDCVCWWYHACWLRWCPARLHSKGSVSALQASQLGANRSTLGSWNP